MNSLPRLRKTGTALATTSSAAAITSRRRRTTARTIGAYARTSQRLIGFACSPRIRPRISSAASAGVSVTESTAAKPIA